MKLAAGTIVESYQRIQPRLTRRALYLGAAPVRQRAEHIEVGPVLL